MAPVSRDVVRMALDAAQDRLNRAAPHCDNPQTVIDLQARINQLRARANELETQR
ncbi:hypothetical protein [Pseudactinotalea sp. Z1732]|uniref:hypothetical protein n=1 Tax=Micrococcales TaxID=85006 RepID=UPI003C7A0590